MNHLNVHRWPTEWDDVSALALFLTVSVVLPALGYVMMVLDYRAYLRSLRRSLVRLSRPLHDLPGWATLQSPSSLRALGLRLPCSEEDVLHAYRARVKQLHPDRGGDKRRFLALQRHFEEALLILGREAASESSSQPRAART